MQHFNSIIAQDAFGPTTQATTQAATQTITLGDNSAAGTIFLAVFLIINLALAILVITGIWRTFAKAQWPGWAVLIPIYNLYVLVKVANRPGWWVLLLFIPVVNVAIGVVLSLDTAARFGKSALFGLGLFILPPVFYIILGFGNATYRPMLANESMETR